MGKIKSISREYYETIWSEGDIEKKKATYTLVASGRAREVMPYLENKVLDMGCGIGIVGMFIPTYWGVDWSEAALKIAREDNPHGTFHRLDLHTDRIPYDDKFFETVLLQEIIEHLDDYSHCLSEAKRLARKRIVITVPQNMAIPTHYHPVWTEKSCRREFGHLGKIVRLWNRGSLYWLMVIEV